MANTTGHEEAKAQVAGETGYEAQQTDAIVVFADGRTEHVSIFSPSSKKVAADSAEKASK